MFFRNVSSLAENTFIFNHIISIYKLPNNTTYKTKKKIIKPLGSKNICTDISFELVRNIDWVLKAYGKIAAFDQEFLSKSIYLR